MTTENNSFTDSLINEVVEAQQNLDRIKSEKRQAALDCIHKLVKVFEFSSDDVFSGNNRNISALCKEVLLKNPTTSRKEFMNWAKENNIPPNTAGGQYWKITKEIARIKQLESAVVADMIGV